MPTIVLRNCPGCGARLSIDLKADHATCEYCGAVSRIESKKPKGPPPVGINPKEPVIYVSSGVRGVWIISALMTLGITGAVMFSIFSSLTGSFGQIAVPGGTGSGGSKGQSLFEHMQWVGYRQPMLVELTGDGVLDVVGWVRHLDTTGGTSYEHVAAFNAVSGERIWDTGPIVDTGQSTSCKAALMADKLLISDPTGMVRAYALVNAAMVWQVVMGERVEQFCGGSDGGQVVAHLKDKRAIGITIANGQLTPMGQIDSNTPCAPMQNDSVEAGPFFFSGGGTWDENGITNPKLVGMSSEKVLVDRVTGNTIALGTREPGTRTPMAALYRLTDAKENKADVIWMASVSSVNPLTLYERAPEHGAISQGRLLVPYALQDSKAGCKISCIEETTGRILWDVSIPRSDTGSIGGLNASPHHVFISHWTYLDIFQLADGAHTATIGVW